MGGGAARRGVRKSLARWGGDRAGNRKAASEFSGEYYEGKASEAEGADGLRFVGVDGGVVRQSHDLKGLVDDGRERAEGDLAALVHHLLDDLDEDGDADRVDDLRLAQVEQEDADAVVHQLVRAIGDLLAADVVDVALCVEDRARGAAVDRDS